MRQVSILKIALPCAFLLGAAPVAVSQQIEGAITVNIESVPTANRDKVSGFGELLRSYLGNYNYGASDAKDKITCSMNVFFTSASGTNKYSAQVFLGSQRPVYKSGQNTAILRLFDDSWDFTFVPERPLEHNMYTFNDLTTFLDFYMLLVLGFDYDSYDELGGSAYFQKAADLASLGALSGGTGWQSSGSGFKRTKLVQEILSGQFTPVRRAIFRYHFMGLDSMAIDRQRGWQNIIAALEAIGQVRKKVDPQNLFIKLFFETKYQEIAGLFVDYPDPAIYARLIDIDREHQQTYVEYAKKRK